VWHLEDAIHAYSQFLESLCTSDLQFGFKQDSSTNMCTMILKETVVYYLNKGSSFFVLFLMLARRLIE